MNELQELVKQRKSYLERIIKMQEEKLKQAPEGKIHITGTSKRPMFYFVENKKRIFVKEKQRHLIQPICQKEYDLKVFEEARKEIRELEKFQKKYPEKGCESIYQNLHPIRQQLITPIWLPDDEFVKQWEAVSYTPKGFDPKCPEYYTDKGERVRSKSEVLIANALKKYHIPYRFEYPYQLEPYSPVIHPDFTVLNVRKRKEYIWEHLGKMDDEGYIDYSINRIIDYEKHGIFSGDKLILTHETLARPLNSKIIEKTILHYLI